MTSNIWSLPSVCPGRWPLPGLLYSHGRRRLGRASRREGHSPWTRTAAVSARTCPSAGSRDEKVNVAIKLRLEVGVDLGGRVAERKDPFQVVNEHSPSFLLAVQIPAFHLSSFSSPTADHRAGPQ